MYAYLDFYAYFMYILLNISPLLQHSINTLASQEQAEHNPIFPLGGIKTQKKVTSVCHLSFYGKDMMRHGFFFNGFAHFTLTFVKYVVTWWETCKRRVLNFKFLSLYKFDMSRINCLEFTKDGATFNLKKTNFWLRVENSFHTNV